MAGWMMSVMEHCAFQGSRWRDGSIQTLDNASRSWVNLPSITGERQHLIPLYCPSSLTRDMMEAPQCEQSSPGPCQGLLPFCAKRTHALLLGVLLMMTSLYSHAHGECHSGQTDSSLNPWKARRGSSFDLVT